MKVTCPQCDSKEFITTATVVEEWAVDEIGEYIYRIDFVEVSQWPHPDNSWFCRNCGAEATVEH